MLIYVLVKSILPFKEAHSSHTTSHTQVLHCVSSKIFFKNFARVSIKNFSFFTVRRAFSSALLLRSLLPGLMIFPCHFTWSQYDTSILTTRTVSHTILNFTILCYFFVRKNIQIKLASRMQNLS